MIKILQIDTGADIPFPHADNLMQSELRGLKTLGGSSLAGKFPHLSLVLADGCESPPGLVDYFKVGLLTVVSAKLKGILQIAGAEVEFFPVSVSYHNELLSHYFVAHPLKRFNAIDLSASDLDIDDELGDALSVRRLVLDESKFQDTRLAVISEIQQIAVSKEVYTAVIAAGCIGCRFVEPATVRY